MSLTAIILAAGRSTRLKSARSKPLHEVCGRPMLEYVLEACYAAGCERVLLVVGYGREQIVARFGGDSRIAFVEQDKQLGTGHAVRCCEPHLRRMKGDVFMLVGDAPLIRGEVLRTLRDVHHQEHAAASIATAVLDDPTGYGRIIRDQQGAFLDIVEQPDCTPQQAEIREVNPSYYCVKVEDLLLGLSRLTNQNKKGEYYLTDICGILRRAGRKVIAVQAVSAEDVLAVNNRHQQAEVDAVMQERIQRQIREGGVTIVSSHNTYIEAGVNIGADTVIHPFTFIGRDTTIGPGCVIGPFACVPRDSIVPEGTTVAGNAGGEVSLLSQGS
jgi:bifunctional UDP-N-acetylglucosamine pyrophosphorylase/glucosamine-1-phosphate N-acetyltransferase